MKDLEEQIAKSLLDELTRKKKQRSELDNEIEFLSSKIKNILMSNNRKVANIHGYKLVLETKYEPVEEFYNLLYRKELTHLITKSCSGNNFKKACSMLKLSDEKVSSFLLEKKTKWLYITQDN